MKYAVQMYSLRDDIKDGKDLLEILGKIKEIGYDGVEFCNLYGLDYETVKKRLDELDMKVVGRHVGVAHFEDNFDDILEYCKVFDCKTIGVGSAPSDTLENLNKSCAALKTAYDKLKEYGITVYFHNHTREFVEIDGVLPIDEFKKVCALEIDTYWSYFAGVDTPRFLKENKDKIVHVHLKDGNDGAPCALGEGTCNVAENVAAAEEIGLEWAILENDFPQPNGIDDIKRSMKFLKSL